MIPDNFVFVSEKGARGESRLAKPPREEEEEEEEVDRGAVAGGGKRGEREREGRVPFTKNEYRRAFYVGGLRWFDAVGPEIEILREGMRRIGVVPRAERPPRWADDDTLRTAAKVAIH